MGTLAVRARVGVIASVAVTAAMALCLVGWLSFRQAMELSIVLVATILTSAASSGARSPHPVTMPPSFVFDLTAVLLFGPIEAMLVAGAGVITHHLAREDRPLVVRRLFSHLTVSVTATLTAGLAYQGLNRLFELGWPWHAFYVLIAVAAYLVARGALVGVVLPLSAKRPVDPQWPDRVLHGAPNYVIGASLAATLAALIEHRMWDAVVLAALPLYFAYRAYSVYLGRAEDEYWRREVIASLDEGMAVVDAHGHVTFWNDVLERLVGCGSERAMRRLLNVALPAIARTELPLAVEEVLSERRARTLEQVTLSLASGRMTFRVKILPISSGAALLWQDITERARAEIKLKRSEERLAVAAECANDGLWEWDFAAEQLYMSGRWRAMVGLDATPVTGRPEDWMQRVHPDDVSALQAALEATLGGSTERFEHEHRVRHEDGGYRRFMCRGLAVRGSGRRATRIAGSLAESDRVTSMDRLQAAGGADPLTGLCNRAVFVEGLGRCLDNLAVRRGPSGFAVLYLDLDRFKVVNDSLGHMVGDELLVSVSQRLLSCLRPGDTLARLGGDEFAILLGGLNDEQQTNAIAFRIQEKLSAPFFIGGREVFTSASIGIAFGPAHYTNPDDIMRDADTAMYHAKSRGKARHELFDADMHARVRDRLDLESDLRAAVSANDFEVHYQPIVSLATGRCIGFESLIRWTRSGKPVSPATFIPVAEELGLIESVGTWVLQQACLTFADWQQRFPDHGLDCITVNVSSRQLMQQNFLRIVEKAVGTARLHPRHVRLEITETALMDNQSVVAAVLKELREFGVKIYLDDFGTGCSSLSHLHKLPVDALKIDRSFVTSLLLPERPAMVESILALARTLNTGVVAEGIENDEQAYELERLGCTQAQGYLFSRPLAKKAAEDLIKANQPLGPKRARLEPPAEPEEPGTVLPPPPFEWPERIASRAHDSVTPRVPPRVA